MRKWPGVSMPSPRSMRWYHAPIRATCCWMSAICWGVRGMVVADTAVIAGGCKGPSGATRQTGQHDHQWRDRPTTAAHRDILRHSPPQVPMRHGQLGVLLAITTIVDAQNLDLAPLGTATQSAIAFGGNPLRAIDGNRDGIFAHNSVTHTPNQAGNYLEVVIPVNLVHEIVLYNRADCCGSRLANFRVEAWLTGVLLFTRDFFISGGAVAQGGTLRIPLPAPGLPIDTMRVTQLGPGPSNEQVLSLAEVELIQYGVQAEVNLAPFGSASLTNPNYATTGREAIDGRTDGFFNNGSVTHTLDMPGNVWRVDLPFRSDLHVIRLWNRTDCCGDRLSNFRLSVFDGATEVFGQDFYTLGGGVPITGPE